MVTAFEVQLRGTERGREELACRELARDQAGQARPIGEVLACLLAQYDLAPSPAPTWVDVLPEAACGELAFVGQ